MYVLQMMRLSLILDNFFAYHDHSIGLILTGNVLICVVIEPPSTQCQSKKSNPRGSIRIFTVVNVFPLRNSGRVDLRNSKSYCFEPLELLDETEVKSSVDQNGKFVSNAQATAVIPKTYRSALEKLWKDENGEQKLSPRGYNVATAQVLSCFAFLRGGGMGKN